MASTCTMYDYLVTNFGNLLHLEQVLWSLKNFVAVLTQGIWKLSRRLKWILAIAIILILVEFTTVFIYAVQGTDTIINKLNTVHLSLGQLNIQILFIVNCGMLQTITAIAAACATILAPNTLINLGIFFCIGRLYVNSLLAALNYRTIIHKDEQRLIGSGGAIIIET
ncbi:hypothetical protein FB446DRAFT_709338 [Lentinula raphanica]|nr:hypothetical protein FB446DRAFT_709338 [Lentinula raphanica]